MSNEEFPFTTPESSDARMFIQWKGTKVCLDFHCPCGNSGHVDDDFVYYVHCPACGSTYEMGTQVIARRTTDLCDPEMERTVAVLYPDATEAQS